MKDGREEEIPSMKTKAKSMFQDTIKWIVEYSRERNSERWGWKEE